MHFQSQLGQTKVVYYKQGKNATKCFMFSLGKSLSKIENARIKKVELGSGKSALRHQYIDQITELQ